MKKIIINNRLIWSLNILVTIFMFCFVMSKHVFPVIGYSDFIYCFSPQYFYSNIQVVINVLFRFLIVTLPCLLKINIQDFAFVSIAAAKSIYFIIFAYMLTLSFYKFQKKNILMPFLLLTMFVFNFSLICKFLILNSLSTVRMCNYVILPIIYFLGFMLYILDFYVNDKKFKVKDYIYTTLLCLLLVSGSYVTICVPTFFMLILLLDAYISKKQEKNYIFTSLIAIFILGRHIVMLVPWMFFKGALQFNDSLSKIEVLSFFKNFVNIIFIDNLQYWAFIFAGIIFLLILKNEKNTNYKIIRVTSYLIISYLLFMALTVLLKPECSIFYFDMSIKDYWYKYSSFLLCFNCFLLFIIFYIWGYIVSQTVKFYPVFLILFLILAANSFSDLESIGFLYGSNKMRKSVYMTDKILLFYLKQGKTAVLPSLFEEPFIPLDIHYEQILNKHYTLESSPYLLYVKKFYNVNVTPGFIFKPTEEALKEYEKAGGTLNDEELKELKFSNLNK